VPATGSHPPPTKSPPEFSPQDWLGAIIDSSDDAIISKTLDGVITTWNGGAQRIFGYAAEEVIGRPITLIIPEERLHEEPAILRRMRQGERVEHFETVRRRKDGTLVEVSVTISPVRTPDGRIVGISKIARDIMQAKRVERELTQAKEEALAASRAKDDFLAALSHELRTPLNPVLLLATAAAEDPEMSEALRQDFKMIADNITLQARLIDDLLDFNRLSRGKLMLARISVDVHEAVREAARAVQDDLQTKSIRLTFALEARRARVLGDPVRLMQVFWNGFKNAVKFTPATGEIDVFSRLIEEKNLLEIRIEDTGIGMSAEELARVFQPFVQGNHARERGSAYGGLGLGLVISRNLVEAHGGSIWMESAGPNQGASLFIRLPLEK